MESGRKSGRLWRVSAQGGEGPPSSLITQCQCEGGRPLPAASSVRPPAVGLRLRLVWVLRWCCAATSPSVAVTVAVVTVSWPLPTTGEPQEP